MVNHALKAGKQILAEGAQGSMLDIDFGTYPYVTSSSTITKYTIMINGVTDVVLTKLDVLDEFESIKVGAKYEVNGSQTDELPYDLVETTITPVLEDHKGWATSLDAVTKREQLPAEAKAYLAALETHFGVPISMVSTGPERRKLLVE